MGYGPYRSPRGRMETLKIRQGTLVAIWAVPATLMVLQMYVNAWVNRIPGRPPHPSCPRPPNG